MFGHFLEPSPCERPQTPADFNQASQVLTEAELLDTVKVNLEDGATDGKKPTVVHMKDKTFQLQRGMLEFSLKEKTNDNYQTDSFFRRAGQPRDRHTVGQLRRIFARPFF